MVESSSKNQRYEKEEQKKPFKPSDKLRQSGAKDSDQLSQSENKILADETRRVLFIGALGAGKSTLLNVLNSKALKRNKKEFVASSQLTGCTQSFDSDTSPFSTGYQIQLIDSPGLGDPNFTLPLWVKLYNQTIFQQKWPLDLVVCVIEFCERPSNKEYTVFGVLNQALAEIQAENLLIVFNKVPEDTEPCEARAFYDQCCQNVAKEDELNLPVLTDSNCIVLERKGRIKANITGMELIKKQSLLIENLVEQVWPQFVAHLEAVKEVVAPQEADREKIALSMLDPETKKDMDNQKKAYEAKEKEFDAQIDAKTKEFNDLQASTKAQIEAQTLALQSLRESFQTLQNDHTNAKKEFNDLKKANTDQENRIKTLTDAATKKETEESTLQMVIDLMSKLPQPQPQQKDQGEVKIVMVEQPQTQKREDAQEIAGIIRGEVRNVFTEANQLNKQEKEQNVLLDLTKVIAEQNKNQNQMNESIQKLMTRPQPRTVRQRNPAIRHVNPRCKRKTK